MDDITFVRTRWNYESYTDFWKLVELSGFPFVYVDEVDLYKSVTYILSPMNGEWKPFMDDKVKSTWPVIGRDCELISWNLERPGDGGIEGYARSNHDLIDAGYVDHVIVSDFRLASQCDLKFVPLGSHVGLGTPGTKESKVYDFIHLSCYSLNRSWLFNDPSHPRSNLCGYSVATNGWGEHRHERLMKSRFMLNVHQDNHWYIEPLRFALAAAYGLPILTERCYDSQPYHNCPEFERQTFCIAAKHVLDDYDSYSRCGMEMRSDMTDVFTFRRCLEMFL